MSENERPISSGIDLARKENIREEKRINGDLEM